MSSSSPSSAAGRDIVALEGVTKRFPGIVANDSTQFAWFGDDDSWYRWPLPLV